MKPRNARLGQAEVRLLTEKLKALGKFSDFEKEYWRISNMPLHSERMKAIEDLGKLTGVDNLK